MGRSQAVLSRRTSAENKENGKKTSTEKMSFVDETLSRAEHFRICGKGEKAVDLLMDLKDERYGTLTKVDKLKMHDTFSSITTELGWLSEK